MLKGDLSANRQHHVADRLASPLTGLMRLRVVNRDRSPVGEGRSGLFVESTAPRRLPSSIMELKAAT
jgi:hypothetical protein